MLRGRPASLRFVCLYAINTWHKVVAIDRQATHVHRPYVLSCFCASTQEKSRARIPARFTCTRITYAPGLLIKKYHRWGKSTLPRRWRPGHSIGRLLTPVVFWADFSTEDLQVCSPCGSAEDEHRQRFAPFKGDGRPDGSNHAERSQAALVRSPGEAGADPGCFQGLNQGPVRNGHCVWIRHRFGKNGSCALTEACSGGIAAGWLGPGWQSQNGAKPAIGTVPRSIVPPV